MDKNALTFAEQQRKLILDQMQKYYGDLTASYESDTAAADKRRQELLNTIELNLANTEADYTKSARQAYVGSQLAGNKLGTTLNQLGLSKSGFGVGQQMDIANQYSGNLAGLQSEKSRATRALGTERTNAGLEYDARLNEITSGYNKNKSALDQYVSEQGRNVYNQSYQNYIDEKRYKDSLKQQAFENTLALKASRSSGNGNGNDPYKMPQVNTPYYKGDINQSALEYGVFSNGNQPAGISGYGAVKPHNYQVTFATKDLKGNSSKVTQKVWYTGTGKNKMYWVWDGRRNSYVKYDQFKKNNSGVVVKKVK